MSDFVSRADLNAAEARGEKAAKEIEERAESALVAFGRELKMEVRWLIVASVALNQIFNNVDLPSVAKAGVAATCIVGFKVGTLFLSSR